MRPITIILFIAIFCLTPFFGKAQQTGTGKVELIHDPRIDAMLTKMLEINEKKDGKIAGFRVQIHFGSDSEVAKNVKSKFIQKFDSVPAYEKYEQPNFKIRVGDFRTRVDAFRCYKKVSIDFPGSFIVQDDIEIKELLK